MDITTLTDNEIKALAYDQMALIEQAQRNLQACNQELARREQQPKEGEKHGYRITLHRPIRRHLRQCLMEGGTTQYVRR